MHVVAVVGEGSNRLLESQRPSGLAAEIEDQQTDPESVSCSDLSLPSSPSSWKKSGHPGKFGEPF